MILSQSQRCYDNNIIIDIYHFAIRPISFSSFELILTMERYLTASSHFFNIQEQINNRYEDTS